MIKPDEILRRSIEDWNFFVREIGRARLDKEQQEILSAIQFNSRVSVRSGTARGKDYVAAWAAVCFLLLTPKFKLINGEKILTESTKVAMTAPVDRQIKNIMYPEISKIYYQMKRYFPDIFVPFGLRLVGYDIRTNFDDWFLTGFKADNSNTEAWSGFHAPNVMFLITEASGMPDSIFDIIEGNLQGNSRIVIVFNPNWQIGYAARSTKQENWTKFQLNSLRSANVVNKKIIYPGQVDYEWVKDKVENRCARIPTEKMDETKGDFNWEGLTYRPDDWFRVKVLGMFPEASPDVLIPISWVEAAQRRWKERQNEEKDLTLGVDPAGMGTDDTVFCYRYGDFVKGFDRYVSSGEANHMETAGKIKHDVGVNGNLAFIDTIGEGAGIYSRLREEGIKNVFSCKFSENAVGLKDVTEQYEFINMRAFLFWAIRDWLNPEFKSTACLPENDLMVEELTEIKWKWNSTGKIQIEAKEDIKERLGRSPGHADSLANTFYPKSRYIVTKKEVRALS